MKNFLLAFVAMLFSVALHSCQTPELESQAQGSEILAKPDPNKHPYPVAGTGVDEGVVQDGWTQCAGVPIGLGEEGYAIYHDGNGKYVKYQWNHTTPYAAVYQLGINAGTMMTYYGLVFWQATWVDSCS